MIEYDQSVVRLGLEKAELEREVEKKRKDVRQIDISLDLVRNVFLRNFEKLSEEEKKEVEGKAATLFDFEKRVADEKKKLEDLTLNQKRVLVETQDYEKTVESYSESVQKLSKEKTQLSGVIESLVEDKKQKEKERNATISLLQDSLKEKNKAVSELYELNVKKSDAEHSLEKTNKDLAELNEIISILQTTNKQGLDLVTSFEGERNRLREKEDFLTRKEQDLLLYEKRVEKRAKEAGVDLKMSFK